MTVTPDFLVLTLLCALLTYATRVGGYLVLSRIKAIGPRGTAMLNAVPAAVMTTLVAPAIFSGGATEALGVAIAFAVGLRFGLIPTVAAGTAFIIIVRALG